MAKYIEAADLPEGEKVYLKKDKFGWRVVDPYIPGDGWVKRLFGGKRNQMICVVVIVLAILFYFGVNELVDNYKIIADNPCDFCETCQVPSGFNNGLRDSINLSSMATESSGG